MIAAMRAPLSAVPPALATVLAATAVVALAARPAAAGTVEVTTADDVEAAIGRLQPGDELIVHGGTYTLTSRFSFSLVATAAQPIVIRAAAGERPIFHRPDQAQNIWDIDRAEHVTLRGLEFSGGSAGVRISAARFLTIEDCEIHDTGDVALRANDVGAMYEGLHIVHNHIHDTGGTGEGMYLGCNNGGCQVFASLIERNHVHHTNGPTVVQGDGIELKEGSHDNVIRDNVIHDTHYPCILTYATAGNGGVNVIERNALWGCGDHAIQSAADATIRNNIILGSAARGIAMQPHQSGAPANLIVVHNTVLHATSDAIRVSGMVGSVVIASNAVYSQSGSAIAVAGDTARLTVAGNVGVGAISGLPGGFTAGALATDLRGASYGGAPPMDVFPAPGGGLVGTGAVAYVTADDFNGAPRDGVADVGAYRFAAGGNPGWVLTDDFKDLLAPVGGGDAGPNGGEVIGDGEQGCCQTGGDAGGGVALTIVVGAALLGRRRRDRRSADGAGRDRRAVAAVVTVAIVVTLAASLAACTDDAAPGPQDVVRDPAVRGPWQVGVTTLTATDPAWPTRDLTIEVWYPAVPAAGAELDSQFGIALSSVRDAPPDPRGGPFPLIAFSHGNGGVRFQSVYLTEHLASHGFVVVAPDHPGNTITDDSAARRPEVLRGRPHDVRRAIDAALAASAGADPRLAGMIDGDHVAITGHSYGAYTSLVVAGAGLDLAAMRAACAADPSQLLCNAVDDTLTAALAADFADPRIDAAVALAPAGRVAFGATGLAAVRAPIQIQGGTLDDLATPDGEVGPIGDGLPAAGRSLAMITGAGHFSFTDICALYELLGGETGSLGELVTQGCGPNTIPVARAQLASRTLATAFLDRALRGIADDHGYLDPARGTADVTWR